MVKMPTEVREVLQKQKTIPIATSSKLGVPNVVFIGLLKILDDETLLMVDNFFKKTAANLEENPNIAVICFDPETNKSFQIKGKVTFHKGDHIYEDMKKWVHGVNPKLPARAAVIVKVEAVYDSIWGPTAGNRIV